MDQPRNKMLLTPVNLKLVNDITQSQPFCLDSKTIEWIEFVALVTGYDENRTSYVLTFMDEYSTFQGIIYRKDMEIRPKALRNYVYINSSYAHVVGVLASFEEGPKIIIHSIENIKKYEIINYFKVKVLWSYLVRNKALHVAEYSKPDQSADTYERLSLEQAEVYKTVLNSGTEWTSKEDIKNTVKSKVRKIDEILNDLVSCSYLITNSDETAYHAI